MRKILSVFTACLLAAAASAQEPPTHEQLVIRELDGLARLDTLSYTKAYEYHTLDDEGRVTGSKRGTYRVLRLASGPRAERVSESRSTLKGLRLMRLPEFARGWARFFTYECPVRFAGRDGRGRLTYRLWSGGRGTACFDGLVWTDESGAVVEADGRRTPARSFEGGEELVWPRYRLLMNKEGLPGRLEGEDVLVFHTRHERDKNGAVRPRGVRVRFSVHFSDYRRARTAEPVIVEQGDVEEP
jgi:hypothetical protein